MPPSSAASSRFQRQLMYHPLKNVMPPEGYGLKGCDDIFIAAADGTRLQAWVKRARRPADDRYFHGNAANLGDRAIKFQGFVEAGFGLVAVSYRGCSKSDGHPSEAGIYDDARAGVAYARTVQNVAADKIIYFSESLKQRRCGADGDKAAAGIVDA